MRTRIVLAGIALYAALCAGSAASAYTYTDVYDGTVTGIDFLGLFGVAGTNLDAATYQEVFTINTLAGSGATTSPPYYDAQNLYGGSEYGNSDPVTGTLTINGVTISVGSTGYAGSSTVVFNPNNLGYFGDNEKGDVFNSATDQTSTPLGTETTTLEGDVYSFSSSDGFPPQLGQAFTLHVGPNGVGGDGYLQISVPIPGQFFSQSLENLDLQPTTAYPEPSIWALLMLGVGGIGLMLRRARKTPGFRWRDCFAS